jgi:translocation protein SEC62
LNLFTEASLPPCIHVFSYPISALLFLSFKFVLAEYKMASPGVRPPLPGQQPTHAQIQAMQRQLAIDAEKNGMTVPQFIEFLKKKQQEAQIAQQQGGRQQQGQPQPINPGPPNPAALAVAKFLKSQDLKERTCLLNQQRKPMFKGQSALSSPLSAQPIPNSLYSETSSSSTSKPSLCQSSVKESPST